MRKRTPERIKAKIHLYKEIHPKASLREIAKWTTEIGHPIKHNTVATILEDKNPTINALVEKGKEKFIEKYAGDIAKAMRDVDKNERKAMAKSMELLNQKIHDGMQPELLLKIYTDLKKSQQVGMETTLEMIFTPEQVQKFENINQLIDETIQKKQTQIKISRKIKQDVSPRTSEDEDPVSPDTPTGTETTEATED